MKETNLDKELRKHVIRSLIGSVILLTLALALVFSMYYISRLSTLDTNDKYILEITSGSLFILLLYILYLSYAIRQNMFKLYHMYKIATNHDTKRKLLLHLETLFIIYDLRKLRESVIEEYKNVFEENFNDRDKNE